MTQPPRIPAALSLDGLALDARAAFNLAADAGYSGIAIPTNHPELSPAQLGPSAQRHVRRLLASRGLAPMALRAAGPRGGLADPAAVERTVDSARAALQLARDLGVATVAVNAGLIPPDPNANSTLDAAARTLAEDADKLGITLALTADAAEPLAALLQRLAAPHARATFAPAKAVAAGEDPQAVAQRLAGLIAQFTLADAIRTGQQARAVELGSGQVPVQSLHTLLEELNFTGPTVLDLRDLPHATQAAHHAAALLRPLLTRSPR